MLTNVTIKKAQAKEKQYKIADSGGMYLLILPTGKKYFRLNYRFQGKRKTLALGVYPGTSLRDARQKAVDAKKLLEQGINPVEYKKQSYNDNENNFERIGREWFSKQKRIWVESHSSKIISRLERLVFPWIGKKGITEIKAPDVLSVLQRIENSGIIETAHRVKQNISQIFRYAVATGRAEYDPTFALKGALTPYRSKNMASIVKPDEVAALLRAIDGYSGHFVVLCALKFAPLVFVRPGELRHAEWQEIDFEKSEWKIPAGKMKMKRVHVVPLAKQAIETLEELKPFSGDGKYIFPSVRSTKRPISENTINAALRRMGYAKEEMTGHGFRAMASTLLHENKWPSHLIEMQLAHVETNSVKAAYNHAEYLDERIEMMQWWADYLDSLKTL